MILANKFKRFNKTNEEIIVKSENVEGLSSLLANKVSVVTGKQLSTNDFTNTDKSNVSANTSARHTHSNKSIIDKITQAFIDNWTAAYTHISDTVKHITAAERTKWNGAATSQHTHSNKSILDGITATLVSNWNSAYTHISDAVKHITATERTNWNSAKSKADAALPASSYTAADILKKLLTVDGSGSKLDADLLDGKEATNFASSTHTHTPASIGAANAKHNHSTLDIVRSSNDYWAGNIGSTDRGMINTARSPKSAFLPANCITVEYSSDAGKTWEDYGLSEAQKRGLFALTCDNGVWLSKSSPVSTNDCVRITIEPLDRYVSFDQLYIWFSTGSHACTLDLERSTIGAKDTFSFIRKDVPLGGWSGPNVINFPYGTFGGGVSQTGNNYKYRMTFRTTKLGNSTTQSPTINDIRFYGDNAWAIPNDMVKGDYPFSWDRDMNVNFSKQLKEQGKRVYSDNNKPTPAAIGAATAEQGIKADAALPKSGGTMTGFITLHAAPTANMHPATKKYVDDKMIAAGNGDMTKDVYAQVGNPNLLDNTNFNNIVNQRGASSYSLDWKYSIDRWVLLGTYSVSNHTLTFDAGNQASRFGLDAISYMRQGIEKLDADTYTLSAGIGDTVYSHSFVVGSTVASQAWNMGPFYFVYEKFSGVNTQWFGFGVVPGTSSPGNVSLDWIKLEHGATATPYTPKSYGEELAECSRYFISTVGYGMPGIVNNPGFRCFISTPVMMRGVTPTVTVKASDNVVFGGTFKALNKTATGVQRFKNGILVNIGSVTTGVANTPGIAYGLICDISADI